MGTIGSRIDERGTMACDNGQLLFRRELGGRWKIDTCPVTDVTLGQFGQLIGTVVDAGTVAVERFTPEL